MSLSHVIVPVALSAMAAVGALTPTAHPSRTSGSSGMRDIPVETKDTTDTTKRADNDTVTAPFLGPSLRYGMDTTISPCLDFYQYVNGDWRARTRLGKAKGNPMKRVDAFSDTYQRMLKRIDVILDSAHATRLTAKDPAVKALGLFYESCLVSDSLERDYRGLPRSRTLVKDSTKKDSTRKEQCVPRTIKYMGGAVGEVFARDLFASHGIERMEQLLQALRASVIERFKSNPLWNETDKALGVERLQKLKLRVGMPRERQNYAPLVAALSNNYRENVKAAMSFNNTQRLKAVGADALDRWSASLLTPNAFYTMEHAIEIPTVMFMPPFFDINGDDALNFGGIGMVIGHEIYHSLTGQLKYVENPEINQQITKFKEFNSSFGSLDGWNTNGVRTYGEDIADLGGVLVAYDAWKSVVKASGKKPAPLVDGFTPEQRFFISVGRIWRGKWTGYGFNSDVHAAPFARVNAMVMQSSAFAKAFGCKEGDPMVLPNDRRATIW